MTNEIVKTLRDRLPISRWDKKQKLFVKIQFNKQCEFVCWQRFVSKDRRNWVNWNEYLSIKDVVNILDKIKSNRQ